MESEPLVNNAGTMSSSVLYTVKYTKKRGLESRYLKTGVWRLLDEQNRGVEGKDL
jgi:hypothetical protein